MDGEYGTESPASKDQDTVLVFFKRRQNRQAQASDDWISNITVSRTLND